MGLHHLLTIRPSPNRNVRGSSESRLTQEEWLREYRGTGVLDPRSPFPDMELLCRGR